MLNKQTGETRLLSGATYVVVNPMQAAGPSGLTGKATTWPPQKIPQLEGMSVTLKTTHRDGRMLYFVTASPFKGRLERELAEPFTVAELDLNLDDSDGFNVSSIRAPISGPNGPVKIVDDKSEPMLMQWRGSVEMSAETYGSIGTWSVGWSGFDKPAAKP